MSAGDTHSTKRPPAVRRSKLSSAEGAGEKKWSLAGFAEKLALLIIGFVLTTVIGTIVAERYRKESARTDFEVRAMQSDIDRSIQVFENISQLMDRRLFRMRRLHDVYADNIGPNALETRLADYRAVLIEWNDNINRNRALFAFYFSPGQPGTGAVQERDSVPPRRTGEGASQAFPRPSSSAAIAEQSAPPLLEGNPAQEAQEMGRQTWCTDSFETIAAKFSNAHQDLQKLLDKKTDGSAAKVQDLINDLDIWVYALDECMLARISDLRSEYRDKIARR